MRRGYTVATTARSSRALRAAMPDIALSTDILIGFSGETEDDSRATLALMRELRFDSAFMFAYSERDLTFAAKKLPDDVPAGGQAAPARRDRRAPGADHREVFAAQVGKRERVLVEQAIEALADELIGAPTGSDR